MTEGVAAAATRRGAVLAPPRPRLWWQCAGRGLRLLAPLFGLFLLAGSPTGAMATELRVTKLDDRGAGTLRDAIDKAAAGDVIKIEVAGVIRLTGGELQLPRAITIDGPGAAITSVSSVPSRQK